MNQVNAAHLERFDPARNMARFYRVDVARTLFGEWAVISRWGRIGTHGRSREEWVSSIEEAERVQARQLDRKRRRGYC